MTANDFYAESLRLLNQINIPYLVGGTIAFSSYTGIPRETKDLDIFCKAGDYPKIVSRFGAMGYRTSILDERWLTKVFAGPSEDSPFFDVIFNSANAICPVTDLWFEETHPATLFDVNTRLAPATELIWSKAFVQDRRKFDGSDVAHLIMKQSDVVDWKRLLNYFEPYWEVLLSHLLTFRFVYPSERHKAPRWLLDELLTRLATQLDLGQPETRVCRGRLFSREDYLCDVTRWGFADVVGATDEYIH